MTAMESSGTAGSIGCPDVGGNEETAATTAVTDWLDGKGRAYDTVGEVVRASGSARRAAMWGGGHPFLGGARPRGRRPETPAH
ncbi:hypothetical protein [Actinoplanes auranticolor]|uniref:Uncharacterized protein n=1 Tax=Actinoplanes auranticolor TaxID=47988 RepID=A0A919SYM0_9ACTN|nr:hypothetical protein Aau02nite_90510 [Actinoplanes auranticolor]